MSPTRSQPFAAFYTSKRVENACLYDRAVTSARTLPTSDLPRDGTYPALTAEC